MKVLVGANFMGLEKEIPNLQKRYPEIDFVYCPERERTAELIGDADIYMGWLNQAIFKKAQNLKWIQSPSSGINYYLDVPELVESDVLLTSASGTHAPAVAESTLAMILAFTRGIRDAILYQPQHEWAGRAIRPKLIELSGTTLGIIGFGNIGRALAKRAAAFDMRIIAVDLYPSNKPDYVEELWGLDRLNELMRQADFPVVLVPFTAQTANMIGAEEISHMKPSGMLVVMSRGGIVDEKALTDALREKIIAAAALDVFGTEPLPADSELWDMENVLVAPHIAGGTQYEAKHVIEIFTENLDRFLKGESPLRNQVNKLAGF